MRLLIFSAGIRYLSPLNIHRIIFFIDQVRYLHELIALILKCGDERIQRLRGILRTVVAQDDRTIAEMLVIAHRIDDGVHAVILPVEGIHVRYTWSRRILGVAVIVMPSGIMIDGLA